MPRWKEFHGLFRQDATTMLLVAMTNRDPEHEVEEVQNETTHHTRLFFVLSVK